MADLIEQGPRAGRNWPAEDDSFDDPNTGARARRLTGYPGVDDTHLYFTKDGWYDDGRRLLFRSDRSGSQQLYSVDLETGLITQLTDFEGINGKTSVDQDREDLYFWVEDALVRFDLSSLRVADVLTRAPDGYVPGCVDVNADGTTVYFAVREDVDLPGERSSYDELLEAKPHTEIRSVPTDGGEATTLREVDRWASSHVNASPTRPELFMYAEEGPWAHVVHRIWSMNAETGETWKVREMPEAGGVGHEYWMQDGERIGYHGSLKDPQGRERVEDPEPFLGSARFDGTDRRETSLPKRVYALTHTHANSPDLHVCDGTFNDLPYNLLYRWNDDAGEYEGPRMLATVDWGDGSPHPHSRFSPDGSTLVFDSDRYDGSSNLFLVEVPDFEDLPEYEPPAPHTG